MTDVAVVITAIESNLATEKCRRFYAAVAMRALTSDHSPNAVGMTLPDACLHPHGIMHYRSMYQVLDVSPAGRFASCRWSFAPLDVPPPDILPHLGHFALYV